MTTDTKTEATVYVCPRIGKPLVWRSEALESDDGSARYAVAGGVPNFLQYPPAESPDAKAELRQMVETARERGWEHALWEKHGADSRLYRYVTDASRANFLPLLPLLPDADVLEIGPGLAQFTVPIAQRVRSLCALEVVPEQAEFALIRAGQSGCSNVSVACGGDDCRLPYADAAFDVVVCNLVFEWCASRVTGEEPAVAQRRMLHEMVRVLKPGGSLFLHTKNRFAMRCLLGGRDEHVEGLRFGNALPAWLRRLLLRMTGKEQQGLLHSHGRLRRMFQDAGLEDIRSFWAAPEMRYPDRYVPNDVQFIKAARKDPAFVQGDTRLTRMLMPLVPARAIKHVTPGLTFLATKR